MNGEDNLDAQIIQRVQDELASQRASATGDSPIERLLYRAIQMVGFASLSQCSQVLVANNAANLAVLLRHEGRCDIVMTQQADAAGWRADFLIHAWDFGRGQWRRLIVECDGHEFHERTKEQAVRDRSRDRKAQMLGFAILRFTGSEIHRDPLGCALQIAAWAEQGW